MMSVRSPARPERIAVVGGGAAGTLTAVHLMRYADRAIEITIIDAAGSFGPGVAYDTDNPLHVLNIPACRMGGVSGEPDHFHRWLLDHGTEIQEEEFVSRGLFGAYLRDLLADSERASRGTVSLRRVNAEAKTLAGPEDTDGPYRLDLSDGDSLEVDQVVLALGALRSGDPVPVPAGMREAGIYISDPWADETLRAVRDHEYILAIGTGLTMVDVVLDLGSRAEGPKIRAVSRHGLIPRRHRRELTRIRHFPVPVGDGRLEPVVIAVLEQIDRVALEGGDWRDVLDSLRPATPDIWRALDLEERRRFHNSLARLWHVHRFRMAPEPADRFEDMVAAGRVSVEARTIVAIQPHRNGARVSLRSPGEKNVELIDVDRIVNCTGPGSNIEAQAAPLLRDLLDTGFARIDGLGIGLEVDRDGSLIEADGAASRRIKVVGQLRRGVELETVGIAEIREHAAAAARGLLNVAAERAQTSKAA
jgi:uncharacterized NAD(P)/FAD-binding protein YdhS